MSIIRPNDLPHFIQRTCRQFRLILIYGQDEGMIRARTREITASILGKKAEDLSLLDFEVEPLNADPLRLIDEANAFSMFGGHRVIVVRNANKLHKNIYSALLETPPIDSTVLFQADELQKTAPLRLAFEQNQQSAVIACYAPSRSDLHKLVEQKLHEAGLNIAPTAMAHLSDKLGTDYALAEMEIEKLCLFARGKTLIESADIDAILINSSDENINEPIDRAFEGKLEEVEALALRCFSEGTNPSALIALALNHAFLLQRLSVAKASGQLEQAMRGERLFFKRQDRVKQQAQLWNSQSIKKAIAVLAKAQDESRRIASLGEAITIRALWALALASRSRG